MFVFPQAVPQCRVRPRHPRPDTLLQGGLSDGSHAERRCADHESTQRPVVYGMTKKSTNSSEMSKHSTPLMLCHQTKVAFMCLYRDVTQADGPQRHFMAYLDLNMAAARTAHAGRGVWHLSSDSAQMVLLFLQMWKNGVQSWRNLTAPPAFPLLWAYVRGEMWPIGITRNKSRTLMLDVFWINSSVNGSIMAA